MPFIPVPNTAMVEFRMTLDDQHVENTIYVQGTVEWNITSLATLATSLQAWWLTNYAPNVSEEVVLREVVATSLENETAAQATVSGDSANGTNTSGSMPSNVTLTVSFRTGLRGRSFRGRNYIVGVPQDQVVDINHVQGTYAAAWIDAYSELLEGTFEEGQQWVIVSRFEDGSPRETGIASEVLTVTVVDDVIDSQRRRLPGRGS
jgi:hypothetical protein